MVICDAPRDRLWQTCFKQCTHNNLSTHISNGSLENNCCLNVFGSVSRVYSRSPWPLLCARWVWTLVVLTDTGPAWDGHYLWPRSGYCKWPRNEMKIRHAEWGIKNRGTQMSVLINLLGSFKSMTAIKPACVRNRSDQKTPEREKSVGSPNTQHLI